MVHHLASCVVLALRWVEKQQWLNIPAQGGYTVGFYSVLQWCMQWPMEFKSNMSPTKFIWLRSLKLT